MRIPAAYASVTIALAASGCAFSDNFTGRLETINRSIEKIQNEAILQNIVRASEGVPLSFTQLVVVRGSGTVTGTVGGSVGGGVPDLFGPNSAAVSSNTNFDVGVLESKEFWLGLQTPMKAETLDYFIREGLPREIVFSLFINSVALGKGNARRVLVNDPNSPTYPEFKAVLRLALQHGLTTEIVPHIVQFGPPLSAEDASNMKDLVELAKAGLVLRPTSTTGGVGYQVESVKETAVICFDPALAPASLRNSISRQETCEAMGAAGGSTAQKRIAQEAGRAALTFTGRSGRMGDSRRGASVKVHLRSVLDIFHYLGWLVRTGTRVHLVADEARSLGADPLSHQLFVVETNSPRPDNFIFVEHRGAIYSIPIQAAATIRVLTLLRRLVALSTSVNALPVSSTVTVAR